MTILKMGSIKSITPCPKIALSKLNQTQDSLDKKLQTIDDRITAAQIETTAQRDVTHSPKQSFNRQGAIPRGALHAQK